MALVRYLYILLSFLYSQNIAKLAFVLKYKTINWCTSAQPSSLQTANFLSNILTNSSFYEKFILKHFKIFLDIQAFEVIVRITRWPELDTCIFCFLFWCGQNIAKVAFVLQHKTMNWYTLAQRSSLQTANRRVKKLVKPRPVTTRPATELAAKIALFFCNCIHFATDKSCNNHVQSMHQNERVSQHFQKTPRQNLESEIGTT